MVLFAPPINQLNKGDIIPALVWKDRSIKKDVKLINVVGGRVILGVEGTTEALRLDDFQKLVKLTNESLETVREEFEAKKQAQALEETRKAEAIAAAAAGSGASDNPFDLAGRPAAPKPMPNPMPKRFTAGTAREMKASATFRVSVTTIAGAASCSAVLTTLWNATASTSGSGAR